MLDVLSFLALTLGAPAAAQPPSADACQALAARLDPKTFAQVRSQTVSAAGDMPDYCKVTGTIRPSVGFEMRLPLQGWNGNFFQAGCGGYCGQLTPNTPGYANGITASVRRGYASIHTDSGHPGASQGDSGWARGNRQALELYAHRWIPLAYAAGVDITRTFYGRAPHYRYFVGCSNGGRLGLMAAQRYPKLFNGIVSGCPALDLTNAGGAFGAWKLKVNRDDSMPILSPAFVRKLPMLTAALNAQCDAGDGQIDGLIAEPTTCKVDYAKLPLCPAAPAGQQSPDTCLTPDELRVVRLWHQGPVDSAGRRLFGGMPIGSEDLWRVWYLRDPSEAVGTQLADGFTRNIAHDPARPDFSAYNFDFDRDPARLARDFGMLNANNPDLSAFNRAGGKLIMWHGMADPLVVPTQSMDYYDRVRAKMGGTARVQRFFRFFLAPGLGHCWEIPSRAAPEEFDPLTAIEHWVEHGQAPQEIVARPSPRQGSTLRVSEVRYRPYPASPVVVAAKP